MGSGSRMKSVLKAVSWRIIGAVDTFFLTFLMTGHWNAAVGVASFEVATKMFLYYGHERAWESSWMSKLIAKLESSPAMVPVAA